MPFGLVWLCGEYRKEKKGKGTERGNSQIRVTLTTRRCLNYKPNIKTQTNTFEFLNVVVYIKPNKSNKDAQVKDYQKKVA